jgi:hypothetical protein
MICLWKKFVNFLRKIICCGSETTIESKIDCKIECCSTHNGTENKTEIEFVETPHDTPTHKARSLRDSPVVSREGSIRIATPVIGAMIENHRPEVTLKLT